MLNLKSTSSKKIIKLSHLILPFLFTIPALASNWKEQSNKLALEYAKSMGEIFPESGSATGFEEFDSLGTIPNKNLEQKTVDYYTKWEIRLKKEMKQVKSKDLKVDYAILLESTQDSLASFKMEKKLKIIDFSPISQSIFGITRMLVNDQTSDKRKKAAVDRFLFYMNPGKGKKNLIQASKDEFLRMEKEHKGKSFYPYKGKVERYLQNSPTLIEGLKSLLEKTGRKDWKDAYKQYKKEMTTYDDFVKSHVLKKARTTPNEPLELYRFKLKNYGNTSSPEELIRTGKRDFDSLYKEYQSLAKKISKKYKLKEDTPLAVIKFLKKKQITKTKAVEKMYQTADKKLEKLIKNHNLVTLPKQPLKIRVASDAESKASPVPHLIPPPLINKTGIVPEFVVPSSSSGSLPYDDFSYEAAALLLTAHEGRPGHDLQFSRIIETDVSQIRARYAFNSVNVEGWALYAEDLIYPYVSDEEKLSGLMMRLTRIARYFLDPMVQLGKVDEKGVYKVLVDKVGLSLEFSKLEFKRYAFRMPGQAPSYYHGLLKIRSFKKYLEDKFGKMELLCFHDTLLSFGVLPHELIKTFENDFKKCSAGK